VSKGVVLPGAFRGAQVLGTVVVADLVVAEGRCLRYPVPAETDHRQRD
jgi:hypothetical protein